MRALLALSLLTALSVAGCSKVVEEPTSDFKPAPGKPSPPPPTKLEIEDVVVGSGRAAQTGDAVSVQYTGTLMSGEKFDSSYDHGGTPFKVTLGKGEVIQGWDQGLVGMKVGGKRKLRIPPELGYGEQGSPPTIPANASLVFDVALVSFD